MTRFNGAVITPLDFKREITKRDNELLERISKSKSVNKKWIAEVNGFDADYDRVPAMDQNE